MCLNIFLLIFYVFEYFLLIFYVLEYFLLIFYVFEYFPALAWMGFGGERTDPEEGEVTFLNLSNHNQIIICRKLVQKLLKSSEFKKKTSKLS